MCCEDIRGYEQKQKKYKGLAPELGFIFGLVLHFSNPFKVYTAFPN
jgi:hypothetical protein